MNITRSLVLGGVKSGKSRYAMQLATNYASRHANPVDKVFIATARADDDEMTQRIERHRQERPKDWRVIEEPRHLTGVLHRLNNELPAQKPVVLVDCLTLWLTQLCCEDLTARELDDECRQLVHQITDVEYPLILVSNELNMGVTPLGEISRRYCDAAGVLHQSLATVCESVTLVVAGLPLALKGNKSKRT